MKRPSHNEFSDLIDFDILKHEVHIAPSHVQPYDLPNFLLQTFKGDAVKAQAFTSMEAEFKEMYYQTVKCFQRDPSAVNNPFYVKKYKDLNRILVQKIRGYAKQTRFASLPSPKNIDKERDHPQHHQRPNLEQFGEFEDSKTGSAPDYSQNSINIKSSGWVKGLAHIDLNNSDLLQKNQCSTPKSLHRLEHTFSMPGKGSSSIFDFDQNGQDQVEEDEFGKAEKATVEPMYKAPLGQSYVFDDKVDRTKTQMVIDIDDLVDVSKSMMFLSDRSPKPLMTHRKEPTEQKSHELQVMSSAGSILVEEKQQPKLNIFDLNLDECGMQEQETKKEVEVEVEAEDEKVISLTNPTEELEQEEQEIFEQKEFKSETKNALQLEEDIYRCIEETKVEQFSLSQVNSQQPQPNPIPPQAEQKEDFNIFQMDIPEIPKVQDQQLIPIVINTQQSTLMTEPDTHSAEEEDQFADFGNAESAEEIQQAEKTPSTNPDGFQEIKIQRLKEPSEIPIPSQLQVKPLPLWRQLYSKNKFDCCVQFYKDIREELQRLQFFQMMPFVDEQLETVSEIKRLSDEYSRCVEEDEEDELRSVIKSIQNKIMSIKKEETKKVAEFCLQRNGRSRTAEIYQEIVSRVPGYEPLLLRITKTTKNPHKKMEAFVQAGIMSLLVGESLPERCKEYKQINERFLRDAEETVRNLKQLEQIPAESVEEVYSSQKFQVYLEGIRVIDKISSRVYEVVRLMETQSPSKFKMNKARTDLNNMFSSLNLQFCLSFPLMQQELPTKVWLNDLFDWYLSFLSPHHLSLPHICTICFNPEGHLQSHKSRLLHAECYNLMKQCF